MIYTFKMDAFIFKETVNDAFNRWFTLVRRCHHLHGSMPLV